MSDESWLSVEREAEDGEVAFDYIKSPGFRVTWVDGALGTTTPQGQIHVTFYAERPAIPRRQVFRISEDGETLGEEVLAKKISRESIVREMSSDAVMTVETAESLGNFLLNLVKEIRADEEESSE